MAMRCNHIYTVIRYKVRENKYGNVSRVYCRQCIRCLSSVGSAIASYKVPNIKHISIWDNGIEFRDQDNRVHEWMLKNVPIRTRKEEYERYLSKPSWKKKRESILKRDNNLCQICLVNDADHVHHLTYDNLFNEKPEDLISVCARCHIGIHSGDNSRISNLP